MISYQFWKCPVEFGASSIAINNVFFTFKLFDILFVYFFGIITKTIFSLFQLYIIEVNIIILITKFI
ncbi:MAG: hypothetical protein CMK70_10085 [Pseudohongiella sp.]|nr:hypothetical protein [Pseudohongiella sp.]